MEKMKTMNSRTSRTSTKAQQSPLSTSDCTLRYQLPKYYFSSMSMHYFLRNQQKCWKSLCISMFKKVRNTSLFRSLIWVWSKGQYSLFWAENRPTICSVVHKPTNQQQTGMGKKKNFLGEGNNPIIYRLCYVTVGIVCCLEGKESQDAVMSTMSLAFWAPVASSLLVLGCTHNTSSKQGLWTEL